MSKLALLFLCLALASSRFDGFPPGGPTKWDQFIMFIENSQIPDKVKNNWQKAVEDVTKKYLVMHDLTDLNDPCVVLKDLVLITDILFEVVFNRQITISNLPTLPIVIDGGAIADIQLDTVLTIAINKINFSAEKCKVSSTRSIIGGNTDARDFSSSILLNNVNASLANYKIKGTIGTTMDIDSTGDARVNLQNCVISVDALLKKNLHDIYLPKSYSMSLSVEMARVMMKPDGTGNSDVATYITEYLSMHILDTIKIAEALLNIEGTDTYNSILVGLEHLARAVDTILKLDEKVLCEMVYDRLGCYNIRDKPKKGKDVEFIDLELCLLQMMEIGPMEVFTKVKQILAEIRTSE